MADPHLYLGPWVDAADSVRTAPAPSEGNIDLGGGLGLFALRDRLTDDTGYTYLGDDPERRLSQRQVDQWAERTGRDASATDVAGLLWESLGLMPDHRGHVSLWLGGRKVRSRRFRGHSDPLFPAIRKRVRASYRRIRQRGRPDHTLHRKYLEAMRRKLRLSRADAGMLIPADLPHEPPGKPTTTYSETWDHPDASTMQGDLNWADLESGYEIVSNGVEERSGSPDNIAARAEHDLSSDDMRAESNVVWPFAENKWVGVALRMDPLGTGFTDTEFYLLGAHATNNTVAIYKSAAGSSGVDELASAAYAVVPATALRVVGTADGSDLSVTVGESAELTATDADITGHLRGGIGGRRDQRFEDWSLTDVLAAEPSSGGILLVQRAA